MAKVGCKPWKVRPDGWSPEVALQIAKIGRVKRELTILATPIGIGWRALYGDIATWRKADKDFDRKWIQLMANCSLSAATVALARRGGRSIVLTPELKEKFLEHFSETASKVKSATACGVSWSHIYNVLRPEHRSHDLVFAERVKAVERNIIGEMEDTIVETVRNTDDDRTKLYGAIRFLERRDPENWGKMVEMKHSGEVTHEHEHKVKLTESETRTILERDFARFLPRPEDEPQTIEGEIVATD